MERLPLLDMQEMQYEAQSNNLIMEVTDTIEALKTAHEILADPESVSKEVAALIKKEAKELYLKLNDSIEDDRRQLLKLTEAHTGVFSSPKANIDMAFLKAQNFMSDADLDLAPIEDVPSPSAAANPRDRYQSRCEENPIRELPPQLPEVHAASLPRIRLPDIEGHQRHQRHAKPNPQSNLRSQAQASQRVRRNEDDNHTRDFS